MYRPQPRTTPKDIKTRLKLCRFYVEFTDIMRSYSYPHSVAWVDGADLESMLVMLCVFIGDAEGRPMSASKISSYSGLTRPTVYRRLEWLLKVGKIIRVRQLYYYNEDAINPLPDHTLKRLIDRLIKD